MDVEFETGIILSIIYDARLRNYVIDILKPEYFGDWNCRYLFKQIQKLEKNKQIVNFISLYFFVKDDKTLDDIQRQNLLDQLKTYKDEPNHPNLESIRDGIEPKLLVETQQTILSKGIAKLIDCSEQGQINEAFDVMNRIQRDSVFNKPNKITLTELVSDQFSESLDEWGNIIPTGITGTDEYDNPLALDDVFNLDGIPVGGFLLISAISGGGKSSLGLNIAIYQALRGYNVDYYTLELPLFEMSIRAKSTITGFPLWQISKNRVSTELVNAKMNEIFKSFPEYKPVEFFESPQNTTTVAEIERNLYDSERKGRHVDCLIVDYLDLMKPAKYYTNDRKAELDLIGYDLKGCGQEYKCATITFSQNNRQVERKNVISRFQLEGSFAKVNYSNVLMTINEANMEIETADGEKIMAGSPFLWIDKNTFGRAGFYIFMDYNKANGRFWDITKGD